MLEFHTSRLLSAKKIHKCSLCGGTINVGEKYNRFSGKYDGDMFDDKYHVACQNMIQSYCLDQNDTEYDNWSVADWLHDKYCVECEHYKNDTCSTSELRCQKIINDYTSSEE